MRRVFWVQSPIIRDVMAAEEFSCFLVASVLIYWNFPERNGDIIYILSNIFSVYLSQTFMSASWPGFHLSIDKDRTKLLGETRRGSEDSKAPLTWGALQGFCAFQSNQNSWREWNEKTKGDQRKHSTHIMIPWFTEAHSGLAVPHSRQD